MNMALEQTHRKEKAKRDYKFREERTDLQRVLGDLTKKADLTNTLLIIIAMTLLGIFVRAVLG